MKKKTGGQRKVVEKTYWRKNRRIQDLVGKRPKGKRHRGEKSSVKDQWGKDRWRKDLAPKTNVVPITL